MKFTMLTAVLFVAITMAAPTANPDAGELAKRQCPGGGDYCLPCPPSCKVRRAIKRTFGFPEEA